MCNFDALLASTSACSFPVIWQCPGIHCSAICLCFPLSCRIRSWQSLASVDILVSVHAANSIAVFESEDNSSLKFVVVEVDPPPSGAPGQMFYAAK